MQQIIATVLASPFGLAVIIAAVLVLLLPPLVLRLAGLTGDQIREVLESTFDHVIALVKELRAQNKTTLL